MKSIRYGLVPLMLIIAFLGFQCDCYGTSEEEVEGFETVHDGHDEGTVNKTKRCKDAANFLYKTCFMEWENSYDYIIMRCDAGNTFWKDCLIDAAKNECQDAVIVAEQCGE